MEDWLRLENTLSFVNLSLQGHRSIATCGRYNASNLRQSARTSIETAFSTIAQQHIAAQLCIRRNNRLFN